MSLAERSSREQRLANAASSVERCRKCAIGTSRRNSVYGEGDSCAELMVVGEGPGETEDLLGRPFVGRAGELLDRMLLAIDLPREHVYICNTVKCRPTFDDGQRLRNRAPDPNELAKWFPPLTWFSGEGKPAVSQQVKELEGSCGLPLLERAGKRIRLTEAGGDLDEGTT